jgi:hypothetical protein
MILNGRALRQCDSLPGRHRDVTIVTLKGRSLSPLMQFYDPVTYVILFEDGLGSGVSDKVEKRGSIGDGDLRIATPAGSAA